MASIMQDNVEKIIYLTKNRNGDYFLGTTVFLFGTINTSSSRGPDESPAVAWQKTFCFQNPQTSPTFAINNM